MCVKKFILFILLHFISCKEEDTTDYMIIYFFSQHINVVVFAPCCGPSHSGPPPNLLHQLTVTVIPTSNKNLLREI